MHENKILIWVNLLAKACMIVSDMKETDWVFMFTMISFNKQCNCLNDVCLEPLKSNPLRRLDPAIRGLKLFCQVQIYTQIIYKSIILVSLHIA